MVVTSNCAPKFNKTLVPLEKSTDKSTNHGSYIYQFFLPIKICKLGILNKRALQLDRNSTSGTIVSNFSSNILLSDFGTLSTEMHLR